MLIKRLSWKSLFLLVALLFSFTSSFNLNAAAAATNQYIQNDMFWHDTAGDPIFSQTGNIIKVGSTYYWYGEKFHEAENFYNNTTVAGDSFVAVICYSSPDLINWTNEGEVFTPADIGATTVTGLSGVAYNANTGNYVLVFRFVGDLAPGDGGIAFATSTTPNGHFSLQNIQTVVGNVLYNVPGDHSLFIDDDGQPYLIFCNLHGRTHQYVAPLNPTDFLSVQPATEIFNSYTGGREAPIMFKHNGVYYYANSDLHGWNASHTYYRTATNINGPYSEEGIIQGTEDDFSHVSQTNTVYQVAGSTGSTVMYMGSRWSEFGNNGIGYNQWNPITFSGTTPIFHSLNQWTINAATGAWSAGPDNNYILNPSFEADRIGLNTLVGWTDSYTGAGGVNPNANNFRGTHTGNWFANQYSPYAYTASRYQSISVPNGTYTLSAWVRSSGGQNTAQIYAKNFGGSQLNYAVNNSISQWKQISIPNIIVTNGSIEVGLFSDANASNWVDIDDLSLTRSVSENYDNLTLGNNWGTTIGSTGGTASLVGSVTTTTGVSGQVLQVTGGGTGNRSLYKNFSPVFTGSKIKLDFDWNIGSPVQGTGQLRIQDSAHTNYLTLSVPTGGASSMLYSTNPVVTSAITTTENGGVVVAGSGFNTANQTYHVEVTLNMERKTISFTITNKANAAQTVTVSNIPFNTGASYMNNVGAIELYATRYTGTTMFWTSWLDNFNAYAITP